MWNMCRIEGSLLCNQPKRRSFAVSTPLTTRSQVSGERERELINARAAVPMDPCSHFDWHLYNCQQITCTHRQIQLLPDKNTCIVAMNYFWDINGPSPIRSNHLLGNTSFDCVAHGLHRLSPPCALRTCLLTADLFNTITGKGLDETHREILVMGPIMCASLYYCIRFNLAYIYMLTRSSVGQWWISDWICSSVNSA